MCITPRDYKNSDVNYSFCEELGHIFDQFPRCDMKILLDDFSAKVGRKDIFKLTIGNENPRETNNDFGVRVVNFATSETLVVKSIIFHHCDIHKHTWSLS
jgi:hypothetical protein